MTHYKTKPLFKLISLAVLVFFTVNTILPANALAQVNLLPSTGTLVPLSPGFTPPLIRGLRVYPDNPLKFDFIVDAGDSGLKGSDLKAESEKLIKYFLASLTIPEEDLWVNLSPHEKDRIVPTLLGQTEMGRDMLSQDYLLKQITASLIYPEDELGKQFWQKVYKKAYEQYGTTNIPVDTFNKVWILPDKALVYEHQDRAFVVESHLKVMLEEDYVALQANQENSHQLSAISYQNNEDNQLTADSRKLTAEMSKVSSSIVREIILPAIEAEVNAGKNFSQLRQIYNSLILAYWFKNNLKEAVLNQIYSGKNKIKGVDIEDKDISQKIYSQYLESIKKGAYNLIKSEYDPNTNEVISRKYFSGGAQFTKLDMKEAVSTTQSPAVGSKFATLLSTATIVLLTTMFSSPDSSLAQTVNPTTTKPNGVAVDSILSDKESALDKDIKNFFKNNNVSKLEQIALDSDIANERRAQAVLVLENILDKEGLGSRIYQPAVDALGTIVESNPEFIQTTTILALENILNKEGLDYLVYVSAVDALGTIAKNSPELVQLTTISALENFLNKTRMSYRITYSSAAHVLGAVAIDSHDSSVALAALTALENILLKPGQYKDTYLESNMSIRSIYSQKPNLIRPGSVSDAVVRFLPTTNIAFHPLPQYRLYFNNYFREKTTQPGISAANQYSIGLSAYRLLNRYGQEISDANIRRAVDFILMQRSKLAKRVIFGPETQIINIANIEEGFDLNTMIELEKEAGVSINSIKSFKGDTIKTTALSAIAKSKGRLSIFFSAHGLPESLILGDNSDITISEFADSLMQRGKLEEVTVLIGACFSYDFCSNLLAHLQKRGASVFPLMISSNNHDAVSYNGLFIDNLRSVHLQYKGALTVQDAFDAEQEAFHYQDLAVFYPDNDGQINKQLQESFGKNLKPIPQASDTTKIEKEQPPDSMRTSSSILELGVPGGAPQRAPEFPKSVIEIGEITTPPAPELSFETEPSSQANIDQALADYAQSQLPLPPADEKPLWWDNMMRNLGAQFLQEELAMLKEKEEKGDDAFSGDAALLVDSHVVDKEAETIFLRDADIRARYGRLLRQTDGGNFISDIFSREIGDKITATELDKLINAIDSSDMLGKMLSLKIEAGNIILVFRRPGTTSNRMGLKDMNTVLGEELNNNLIAQNRKILIEVMQEKGLIADLSQVVYDNYKEVVFAIKEDAALDSQAFESKLEEVRAVLLERISQFLKDNSELGQKLEKSHVNIKDAHGIPLYEIHFGASSVESSADLDKAKLMAVIHANQAVAMQRSKLFEGNKNAFMFNRDNFRSLVKRSSSLKSSLMALEPNIFELDEEENVYILKEGIEKILRGQIPWDKLKSLKNQFKNRQHYEDAQEYYAILGTVDFIKSWQVNPANARARSAEARTLLEALKERHTTASVEPGQAILVDDGLYSLLREAGMLIEQEPKLPSTLSALMFSARAPPLKNPAYISIDIINMGGMNMRSFQIELQKIEEAMERNDEEAVNKLLMSSADDVTESFQANVNAIKEYLLKKLVN